MYLNSERGKKSNDMPLWFKLLATWVIVTWIKIRHLELSRLCRSFVNIVLCLHSWRHEFLLSPLHDIIIIRSKFTPSIRYSDMQWQFLHTPAGSPEDFENGQRLGKYDPRNLSLSPLVAQFCIESLNHSGDGGVNPLCR